LDDPGLECWNPSREGSIEGRVGLSKLNCHDLTDLPSPLFILKNTTGMMNLKGEEILLCLFTHEILQYIVA